MRELLEKITGNAKHEFNFDIYIIVDGNAKKIKTQKGENAWKALYDAGYTPTEYGFRVGEELDQLRIDPLYYGIVVAIDMDKEAMAIKARTK